MNIFYNIQNWKRTISLVLLSFLTAGAVLAQETYNTIDEAAVISVEPVFKSVRVNVPVQECWQEAVRVPKDSYNSYTPEILGAILGAGVGNQVGKGRGKDVATVAGAILGGSMGRDYDNKSRSQNDEIRYEDRCKTVDKFYTEERADGYRVTYEYEGNLYTTLTRSNPGESIKVGIKIIPIDT